MNGGYLLLRHYAAQSSEAWSMTCSSADTCPGVRPDCRTPRPTEPRAVAAGCVQPGRSRSQAGPMWRPRRGQLDMSGSASVTEVCLAFLDDDRHNTLSF